MNPCRQCKHRQRCDYEDEEDRCPIVRRERDLSHPLYGDERDDRALEQVRGVMIQPREVAGQLVLL